MPLRMPSRHTARVDMRIYARCRRRVLLHAGSAAMRGFCRCATCRYSASFTMLRLQLFRRHVERYH